MIWRDDDINYMTDMAIFLRVQEMFDKYDIRHTIAVITDKIDQRKDLVDFILSKNMDVQLHCTDHVDFTTISEDDLLFQFIDGANMIEKVFGKRPTTVYPPWNKSNEKINKLAFDRANLVVSTQKISLSAFIRTQGQVKEEVVNFHYWADQETMYLDQALKIEFEKKYRCL